MKRDKHAIFALITALFACLAAPPAPGQTDSQGAGQSEAQQNGSEAAPGGGQSTAAEMITDYLRQDIFLRPGVGLKKVKIGMPFEQVLRTWGAPTSRERHDLIDNKWVYEIGNHTRIALIGGNSIESMRIAGGFNSPYVTSEGASFGMAQHQLATIYGAREAKSGRVSYEERGISFGLDGGQVSEIRVFQPD